MKLLNFFLTSFFVLCALSKLQAQNEHELIGMIQLDDNQMISYRLFFNEVNGKIKGFSVTDLQGAHETKNDIEGTYNKKTKEFFFKETDIVYTKSEIIQDDFCLVNFSGKVKLEKAELKLNGSFKGRFPDGEECINGKLVLVGSSTIYKRMNKLNKKIQKSKKIDNSAKSKVNPFKILDSLKLNTLKEGENTKVYWKSNTLKMELWDVGQEDGDKVTVLLNGKRLVNNYQISKTKKLIEISLKDDNNILVFKAENEGKVAPNTVKVILYDGKKEIALFTNLKSKKTTTVTILKKR